jgi:hypothetical protein
MPAQDIPRDSLARVYNYEDSESLGKSTLELKPNERLNLSDNYLIDHFVFSTSQCN